MYTYILWSHKGYGQNRVKAYLFLKLCKLIDTFLHSLYLGWIHLSLMVVRAMGISSGQKLSHLLATYAKSQKLLDNYVLLFLV